MAPSDFPAASFCSTVAFGTSAAFQPWRVASRARRPYLAQRMDKGTA
jgi:hypothetical protein